MRLSATSLVVASWLFALIVLYYYYSLMNTSNPIKPVAHDPAIRPIYISNALSESRLQAMNRTMIDQSSPQTNDYRRLVLFDWPLDSDKLAYLNYKSFESFLANGMDADTQIEIMIIGHGVASFYKIDHLFRYIEQFRIKILQIMLVEMI